MEQLTPYERAVLIAKQSPSGKVRICSRCKEIRIVEDFHKDKTSNNRHGRRSACKYCNRKILAIAQSTVLNNGYNRGFMYNLKAFWGLTVEEYIAWRAKVDNKCECCGKSFGNRPRGAHIDHERGINEPKDSQYKDHPDKRRRIRGLICRECNLGLGHFNHDPQTLRAAANYLERYNNGRNNDTYSERVDILCASDNQ